MEKRIEAIEKNVMQLVGERGSACALVKEEVNKVDEEFKVCKLLCCIQPNMTIDVLYRWGA